MFRNHKITFCAIIFFLFVISFGLAQTGSKAEAQVGADQVGSNATDQSMSDRELTVRAHLEWFPRSATTEAEARVTELESQLSEATDTITTMQAARRGSTRVKAKKRNACNHARIGASGIQGTCG